MFHKLPDSTYAQTAWWDIINALSFINKRKQTSNEEFADMISIDALLFSVQESL
jgi:hypothetical protein